MSGSRRSIWLLLLALWLLAVAPPAEAQGLSRSEYEACQARDEQAFREAIERVTIASLETSIKGLDYTPIVAEAWRRGGIDEVMARRVDLALEELRQETSWSELITSLASRETQERLARAAAERVYNSEDMRKAIEGLAIGVGRVVGERLELATSDTAEPTTRCLEAFLGPRYGSTVARIVATDAGRDFAVDAARGTATVSRGTVISEHKEGLAGLVAVIMRRQLGNLASRVGQRIAGAVLGRLVSVVAGGVGVVLIAKDIWELRNGVLPIIASEMKSPATRDKVQAELARTVSMEIEAHLRDIGKRTSERVVEIWHEFRRAHLKVLELAERDAGFKRLLDGISPERLGRLDEVVALELASGGEPRLLARAADGSLIEAVERWPDAVLEIARDRRSLDQGFKWRALAGDKLVPSVVVHELHRLADPVRLTRRTLERALALDDRIATPRLAALPASAAAPLLDLQDADLRRLGRAVTSEGLESLAGYLSRLEAPAGKRLLAAVAETPTLMTALTPAAVREAVLASRDHSAAVAMILRQGDLLDAGHFVEDIERVRSGAVSPRLLLWRYPIALGGLALFGLALLALLWRAVAGRRPASAATPPSS